MSDPKANFRVCTVCASNNNRSMEAHRVLKNAGFDVHSYGTGSAVRLPGRSADSSHSYPFGTQYDFMFRDLESKDKRLHTDNGVLNMLDRNRKIKDHPESWKQHKEYFDVVFTCEERCYDAVCHDLMNRGAKLNRLVHVINVDIKDNHQDAVLGGKAILDLATRLLESPDRDTEIVSIIAQWQEKYPKMPASYTAAYF
ncbi:similar to Saccharomyces cerevisiae YNL222W SSU72 Transcription/RNA-processing factor that associates with TFIIB and cleavage/polyadenylation factor Pta1p [Geotrichum candidum]|uniref:RNA polymerase II subunit A C-terminal domain phosphatase SSU72 n=1 Tax=Geotrichum candidum TaxID=1173061 RepID=A0A0J9XGH9_GEOCN|nr:similar to Saccharomyces cerevisiae YNL222W SSU72 Transcription/RNA-processing factor that associates with TFIIB and cleavage/polyadenylation factor Pta1p [Geotrichum candidum]